MYCTFSHLSRRFNMNHTPTLNQLLLCIRQSLDVKNEQGRKEPAKENTSNCVFIMLLEALNEFIHFYLSGLHPLGNLLVTSVQLCV